MELRYLHTFVALGEELHFGRAAERLHLAQPTVTLHLQRLERHVGVQLMARTSHRVWLTPAGEAFVREARRLLAQAELAVSSARAAGSTAGGCVRIGFNYPAGQQILTPSLALLRERHPDVTTTLMSRHSQDQLAALRTGSIDVAFVYGSQVEPGLRTRTVTTLPVVGLCAADHPLAVGEHTAWPQLVGHRCMLPSRRTSTALWDAVVSSARLHDLDLSGEPTFDDGDAAAVMVATHQVIIFASAARARSVARPEVAMLRLVDPVPTVTVNAVWRDEETNPAVPLLLDAVAEVRPAIAS